MFLIHPVVSWIMVDHNVFILFLNILGRDFSRTVFKYFFTLLFSEKHFLSNLSERWSKIAEIFAFSFRFLDVHCSHVSTPSFTQNTSHLFQILTWWYFWSCVCIILTFTYNLGFLLALMRLWAIPPTDHINSILFSFSFSSKNQMQDPSSCH